jgi:uncharacterized Zn finger protein
MMIDVKCQNCSYEQIDIMVKDPKKLPKCTQCGQPTERMYTGYSMQPKGKGTHRSDYNSPTRGR